MNINLMAMLPDEPGLASCPLDSPSPLVPDLWILSRQTITFHILFNYRRQGWKRWTGLEGKYVIP